MATRQYVGARYVPKFYINAVDGSSLWQDNVIYEPLTWVTRPNFRMYISRQTVPATVGAPEDNIDYWLEVGQFNGYITQLQEQIDSLSSSPNGRVTVLENSIGDITSDITELQRLQRQDSDDIDALETSVDALETDVARRLIDPTQDYYIFVSDSYNTHTDVGTWGGSTAEYLGLTSDHYYSIGRSGASLSNGGILACVQDAISNCPIDATNITKFVIGAGANEAFQFSETNVASNLSSIKDAVEAAFPNATLYLAYIGNDRNRMTAALITAGTELKVLKAYRECENLGNFKFIPNIQYVLKNYALMNNEDFLHPVTNGYKAIGLATAKYFLGESFAVDDFFNLTGGWLTETGITLSRDDASYITRHNDQTTLNIQFLLLTGLSWNPSDGTPIKLFKLPRGGLLNGPSDNQIFLTHIPVEVYIGSAWETIDCSLLLTNDGTYPELGLYYNGRKSLTGVTQISIYHQSVTIETMKC